MTRILAARASFLAALLLPLAHRAADLEVSPVVLDLSAARPTAILALRNAGASPARFQVKAFAWAQGPDGKMDLSPSRDLVVFPPLLELAPGESRNVRVGTDRPAGPAERSWRLSVEEIPSAAARPDGVQVRVLTRVGLPVFLAPARERVTRGELVLLPREGNRLRFALRNTGTVRLRPKAVTVSVAGPGGRRLHDASLDAWYVLARGEREYALELPAQACAEGSEIVVTAALEAGPLEARTVSGCRGP